MGNPPTVTEASGNVTILRKERIYIWKGGAPTYKISNAWPNIFSLSPPGTYIPSIITEFMFSCKHAPSFAHTAELCSQTTDAAPSCTAFQRGVALSVGLFKLAIFCNNYRQPSRGRLDKSPATANLCFVSTVALNCPGT